VEPRGRNNRAAAKAGDFLCNRHKPTAQPAIPDSYVYHMIPSKDRAHLCCGQHYRNWQTATHGADLPASVFCPVDREKQQRGFALPHSFAGLLKAAVSDAGPASKTNPIQATLHQQRLDPIGKPRRRCYRAARDTCEDPARYRALEDIAARGQPQTPSGQAGRDIGNELTIRPDHEPE